MARRPRWWSIPGVRGQRQENSMWVRNFAEHPPAGPARVDAAAVGQMMAAMGEADARALPRSIVRALDHDLPVGHCAVFEFSEQARPRLCFEAGAQSAPAIPDEAGTSYVAGHYQADRLYGLVCELLRSRQPETVILAQGRKDISDRAYLQNCYQRGNVSDRLTMVLPATQEPRVDRWLAVNLYRQQGTSPFAVEDLARAEPLLRLVGAAVAARHRLARNAPQCPTPAPAAPALSAREREVADLLCAGRSTPEIAGHLGIAPTTVTTLRKRAYAKLGAANAQEFAARWSRHAAGRMLSSFPGTDLR
jgi:DNA-binding CsgD family transcriptional regulator